MRFENNKRTKYILASFLSFVIFLFLTKPAMATTYYVATNGNDANSGTLTQPFRTIQKGFDSITQAGDTLYIREGNYSVGALSLSNKSGTSTQKITVSGYENERPILNASGRINGLWDNFIVFRNLQHVIIKNLEIANSRTKGIYLTRSSNVTFQNIWIHHTALAAIWAEEDVNNLIIENSRFWQNNKVNDSTCTSNNTSCPGWYAGGQWMGAIHPRGSSSSTGPYTNNVIIRKNEIFESYGECINAHGRVSNLTIEDNTIYNCWAPAIYFPNDKDVLIQRNLVYHTNDPRFLRGGNPGAAIGAQKESRPTRHGEMKNIRIINNLVKGFSKSLFFWQAQGGYLEDTLVAHNTFVDSHSNSTLNYAVDIGPGPHVNFRFENNIVLQDDPTVTVGRSDGSVIFANNLWSKSPPANMTGVGDIVGNVAVARTGNTGAGQLTADYFKILSNSPAIGRAKSSAITEDYFRTVRNTADIGAHEFTGVSSVSPLPSSSSVPTSSAPSKPGDTNGDNKVDGIDYVVWLNHYNQNASGPLNGDFNSSGKVDGVDYVVWLNNYGK